MGLKAFLLIVLAIFLVINSEVAARKLAQSSITSLEKEQTNEENNAKFVRVALPPIGGVLLGIGAPIGFERLSGSGELIEIGAPIESEGLLRSGELIEIGAPIKSGGLP
ncbi:hypothetical protein H5410_049070 [Solanum commersonii]|uniref:Uncharacterized protein n=1 Tax=Solanum commersonii TaxID=4109 RepID=A0A9J5XMT1_SOLCO|nr:hypothetical protein H5410_049070 [Solanum commersonii]